MFNKLLSPIKLRELELKNRVVMPAMGTRMANEDGTVSQILIDYHKARALGGCALNIVEVASVHGPSAPKNFLTIYDDSQIESHKKLTSAIHEAGGKACLQLYQGSIAVGMDPNAQVLVPSELKRGEYTIPAMTIEQIKEIIECYKNAAKRAIEAGYDTLEIHMAHNYLMHSFLSGGFNKRTDEYGGSFENRCRLPLEVIDAVRSQMPEEMPLFIRIGCHDDFLENGMTIDEVVDFCNLAKQHGVDVLDISRGNVVSAGSIYEVPPIDIPNAYNIKNVEYIKNKTNMICMAVGRINHANIAEEVLENNQADLIGMGRALLADPDFVNKVSTNRLDDIVHCVGCNQGCYDGFCDVKNFKHITCLRNPRLGREGEEIKPTNNPKKVWVLGGGVAGMEASLILKKRNHDVKLFEKTDHLGGQFILAGEAPNKQEMKLAALEQAKRTEKNVDVIYNHEVTSDEIKNEKPDAVIISIGASPIELFKGEKIYNANDILSKKVKLNGTVSVIGGGLVGLEVSDLLIEDGCKVNIIEMQEEVGKDLGMLRKIAVNMKIHEQKPNIYTSKKVESITENGLLLDSGEEIKSDYIVCAIGSRPNNSEEIINACKENNIDYYIIGDALKTRRALNAIHEAYDVATNL